MSMSEFVFQADESDEEDQCALSDKWRFQRSSRRWSRKDLDLDLPTSTTTGDDSLEKAGIRSSSSRDSVLTDNEESISQRDDSSPVLFSRHRIASLGATPSHVPASPSDEHRHFLPMSAITHQHKGQNGEARQHHHNNNHLAYEPHSSGVGAGGAGSRQPHESPLSPGSIRRAASERIKGAKNNFLKRMESFKQKKSAQPKKARLPPSPPGEKPQISAPVAVNSDSDSFKERLDTLGCVDVSPSNDSSPSFNIDRLQPQPSRTGPSDSLELDSSFEGADISPSLFKRGGRVFLDESNSSLEDPKHKSAGLPPSGPKRPSIPGPSTYSAGAAAAELPACFSQFGLPTNHSSPRTLRSNSDLPDLHNYTPGSFPKLVANGYIETSSGSQINYRTGSFNLGSESHSYRDTFQKRNGSSGSSKSVGGAAGRASSEEPNSRTGIQASSFTADHRLSVYDNVPVVEASADPQRELDIILSDLFKNINDLTLRSKDIEVELEGQKFDDKLIDLGKKFFTWMATFPVALLLFCFKTQAGKNSLGPHWAVMCFINGVVCIVLSASARIHLSFRVLAH